MRAETGFAKTGRSDCHAEVFLPVPLSLHQPTFCQISLCFPVHRLIGQVLRQKKADLRADPCIARFPRLPKTKEFLILGSLYRQNSLHGGFPRLADQEQGFLLGRANCGLCRHVPA